MNDTIKLILFCVGFIGLSCTISYMWWAKIRVWMLRQDLFLIRDALFDKAREKDFFDHQHYKSTREAINGMIQFAPHMSITTLVELIKLDLSPVACEDNESLHDCHVALNQMSRTIIDYVFCRTASGYIWYRWKSFNHKLDKFNNNINKSIKRFSMNRDAVNAIASLSD